MTHSCLIECGIVVDVHAACLTACHGYAESRSPLLLLRHHCSLPRELSACSAVCDVATMYSFTNPSYNHQMHTATVWILCNPKILMIVCMHSCLAIAELTLELVASKLVPAIIVSEDVIKELHLLRMITSRIVVLAARRGRLMLWPATLTK